VDLTALGGADVRGATHPAHQVGTELSAQERGILLVGDLVSHDRDPYPEVTGIGAVLPVDPGAAQDGLADQQRHVEAGEQPEGEGVSAGGHVHHHVLLDVVDEMVEQQFYRPDLGVVPGHPEIVLGERAGDRQPCLADLPHTRVVDRVALHNPQQPRTRTCRSGLDPHRRRRDPRVDPPQIVLDQR
jgi:hypothetical protein